MRHPKPAWVTSTGLPEPGAYRLIIDPVHPATFAFASLHGATFDRYRPAQVIANAINTYASTINPPRAKR